MRGDRRRGDGVWHQFYLYALPGVCDDAQFPICRGYLSLGGGDFIASYFSQRDAHTLSLRSGQCGASGDPV
jgi:hypothetical protein